MTRTTKLPEDMSREELENEVRWMRQLLVESGNMHDVAAAKLVGIQISHNGEKLWVCVDGSCILRIARIDGPIEVDDRREDSEANRILDAATRPRSFPPKDYPY